MTLGAESSVITADELATLLKQSDRVRVLDASWHMPSEVRNAKKEFEREHISGAQFFDIDDISDHKTDLPHMLSSAKEFSEKVRKLGISNHYPHNDIVIVYDTKGFFSAARAWWMFRSFGHTNVYILNGGLPEWKNKKGALEQGIIKPKEGEFTARFHSEFVQTMEQVEANTHAENKNQLIDARSADRYLGKVEEPRPGVRKGHIPGSCNLPFAELVHNGMLLPKEQLADVFKKWGVNPLKLTAVYCGSGVTACLVAAALYQLGNRTAKVYDGSWAEYGSSKLKITEPHLKHGTKTRAKTNHR